MEIDALSIFDQKVGGRELYQKQLDRVLQVYPGDTVVIEVTISL